MGLFDMSPDQAQNLTNFGFSTMAASAQPGATTLGAIGKGGEGMNAAALQRAQTQNIAGEAQSRQLQNQLIPYQLQFMKMRMQQAQQDQNDDNGASANTPPITSGGQPWSTPLGGTPPTKEVSAKPVNNPGNLRPVGKTTGFQTFNTPQDGVNALQQDLLAKVNGSPSMQGQPPTLRNIIYTYAPPTENNTAAYLENVSKNTGIAPNQVLTADDINKLAPAIAQQEGNGTMVANAQNSPQRNIGQGIAQVQPSTVQPPSSLPNTNAEVTQLNNKIYALSKKLKNAEFYQFPTKNLEINLKAAQDQLAAAMKTQHEVESSGPRKEGEDSGTNKAAAEKTLNVITSNLPIAMKRFQELRNVASDASYGLGAEGKDNEPGFKETLAYQFAPKSDYFSKTANANTVFQQKTAQGVLPELGPSLAQAGIKGNKFLETLANEASGLSLAADPNSKLSGIQGLEDQYIRNLKSTAQQVRSYGGTAPTDKEIDTMVAQMKSEIGNTSSSQDLTKYKNPKMIGKAYQSGEITKEQATTLLQQNHGFQ